VKICTHWLMVDPRRGLEEIKALSKKIGPSPTNRQLLLAGELKRIASTVTG